MKLLFHPSIVKYISYISVFEHIKFLKLTAGDGEYLCVREPFTHLGWDMEKLSKKDNKKT